MGWGEPVGGAEAELCFPLLRCPWSSSHTGFCLQSLVSDRRQRGRKDRSEGPECHPLRTISLCSFTLGVAGCAGDPLPVPKRCELSQLWCPKASVPLAWQLSAARLLPRWLTQFDSPLHLRSLLLLSLVLLLWVAVAECPGGWVLWGCPGPLFLVSAICFAWLCLPGLVTMRRS